ncbi:MAG: DUF4399 domain-containing protein [Pseudomonadota bacterium]
MKHLLAFAVLTASAVSALAGDTPSNPDAKVYFINLKDGDTVASPVKVQFGLEGMGIAPAGVEIEMTGHHHLLLDRAAFGQTEFGEDEYDYGVAADENNIHYGKGQTETVLELSPGEHTLQLVLGDAFHIPHDPPIVSDMITIVVE